MDKERHHVYWNGKGPFIPLWFLIFSPQNYSGGSSFLALPRHLSEKSQQWMEWFSPGWGWLTQCWSHGVQRDCWAGKAVLPRLWNLFPNYGIRGTLCLALRWFSAWVGQSPGTLLLTTISPLPKKGSGTWKKKQCSGKFLRIGTHVLSFQEGFRKKLEPIMCVCYLRFSIKFLGKLKKDCRKARPVVTPQSFSSLLRRNVQFYKPR